jgi:hypothetical protein
LGDEVPTDINQKKDGQIAGTNYCVGKGTRENIKSNTNGGTRFTVIGLTVALGDPVMCIVIFAGKELTYKQWMGHDIWAGFNRDSSIRDNIGPERAFPGAPTCHFCGKDLPALIACSPKVSITVSLSGSTKDHSFESGELFALLDYIYLFPQWVPSYLFSHDKYWFHLLINTVNCQTLCLIPVVMGLMTRSSSRLYVDIWSHFISWRGTAFLVNFPCF